MMNYPRGFVRFLLIVIPFLVLNLSLFAQIDPSKLVPPSPNAHNLMRLGDIPMDYSSGTANVEIPIYQIKSGKLSHSVNLRFIGDGAKVERSRGILGQDWTLNAGGALTRTIRDKPDDLYTANNHTTAYFKNLIALGKTDPNGNLDTEHKIQTALISDMQHDIFSYYVSGGISSKFIFNRKKNPMVAEHLVLSNDSIQFTRNSGGGLASLKSFRIIGDDGTIYVFGIDGAFGFNESRETGGTTGYWLAHIISYDLKDSISFKYEIYTQYQPSNKEYVIIPDNSESFPYNQPLPPNRGFLNQPSLMKDDFNGAYTTAYIKEIKFKDGKLIFTSRAEGADLVLDKIDLLNNAGQAKSSFKPYFSRFKSASNTFYNYVKLDSLKVQGAGVEKELYHFNYYYDVAKGFPNGTYGFRAKDWAGYYNGNTGPSVPSFPEIENWSGGNRKPNPEYAKQGMLKSITYPTKGKVNFEYEGNTFTNNYYGQNITSNEYAPGLRIKKVFTTNSSNEVVQEGLFEYEDGVIHLPPVVDYLTKQSFYHIEYQRGSDNAKVFQAYRQRVFYGDFLPIVSALLKPSISYSLVREYKGNKTNNQGYTEYNFTAGRAGGASGIPPTPYTVSPDAHFGLIGYSVFSSLDIQFTRMYFSPYEKPMLSMQEEYEKEGTGFKLIRRTEYVNQLEAREFFEPVVEQFHLMEAPSGDLDRLIGRSAGSGDVVYFIDSIQFKVGGYRPLSEKITEIEGVNIIINEITYAYNGEKNLKPSSISRKASDGKIHTSRFKYAMDYPEITSTDNLSLSITNLKKKNRFSQPIEVSDFVKNSPISSEFMVNSTVNVYDKSTTSYKGTYTSVQDAGLALTASTLVTAGKVNLNNIMKTDVEIISYDSYNNPKEFKHRSGPPTSYIWDYFGQYPVAEVKNAEQTDIAYAGFEADGKGNWTYSGATITDPSVPVGKRRYALSGGNISKSGLTASRLYLLEYWVKGTTHPSVTGSGLTLGATALLHSKSGWNHYRRTVSGATSLSLSGSSVVIDEVRLYPADAQMTSYTYEPLVGMTSMTDPSGRTVYYEYDAAQRLSATRDLEGHLLESYCYNYAGQQVDCNPTTYSSTAKNGIFTRNTCPSGQTGSQVTYTVPAGTYTSTVSQTDADAQAQADVNANGQAYANANGACTIANVTFYIIRDMSWSGGRIEQLDFWKDGNVVKTIYPTNTQTTETYQVTANNYDYVDAHITNPPGATPFDVYFNFTGGAGSNPCEQVTVSPYTQIIRLDNVNMTGSTNQFWIAEYCR